MCPYLCKPLVLLLTPIFPRWITQHKVIDRCGWDIYVCYYSCILESDLGVIGLYQGSSASTRMFGTNPGSNKICYHLSFLGSSVRDFECFSGYLTARNSSSYIVWFSDDIWVCWFLARFFVYFRALVWIS